MANKDVYRFNIKNANSTYDTYNLRDSRFDALTVAYSEMSNDVSDVANEVQSIKSGKPVYVRALLLAKDWVAIEPDDADVVDDDGLDRFVQKTYSFEVAHSGYVWNSETELVNTSMYPGNSSVYSSAEYDVGVEPDYGITQEQHAAWCEAMVVGAATSVNEAGEVSGENVMRTVGKGPEIDIPVILRVEKR